MRMKPRVLCQTGAMGTGLGAMTSQVANQQGASQCGNALAVDATCGPDSSVLLQYSTRSDCYPPAGLTIAPFVALNRERRESV